MLGAHDKRKLDGTLVTIIEWIIHDKTREILHNRPAGQWDGTEGGGLLNWDYAFAVLQADVMYTKHIQPICLPSIPNEVLTNVEVSVTGWGYTKLVKRSGDVEAAELSKVPKRISFRVASQHDCLPKVYEILNKLDKTVAVIDAGNETIFCGADFKLFNQTVTESDCNGDSGGIMSSLYFHTIIYKTNLDIDNFLLNI